MPGQMGNPVLKRYQGERILVGASTAVTVEAVTSSGATLSVEHSGISVCKKWFPTGIEIPVTELRSPPLSLCITRSGGNSCRVRVTTPKDIKVLREELATGVPPPRDPSQSDLGPGELDEHGYEIGQTYDPDAAEC